MNAAEALTLCRIVRAACPSQKLDEFTPDVWFNLLEDVTFDDAKAAVITVAKRQPFVSPAEIRTEVRRIRGDRLDRTVQDMPDCDPDDVPGYLAALRAGRTRIADGTEKPRPVAQLIAGAVRQLPRPSDPLTNNPKEYTA